MTMRAPLLILTGAFLGAGIVVACGDDSPADVDAQDASPTCDCPSAEPPLAGRITIDDVFVVEVPLPANDSAGNGVTCPAGKTLLSGSCRLQTADPEVTLSEAGFNDATPGLISWDCAWNNPTPRANTGIVRVMCLSPAEE